MARKKKAEKSERVAKVELGEQVKVVNRHLREEMQIVYDQPAAAACTSSNGGKWYCCTHETIFENNMEKDSHIRKGAHRLAWICFAHGPEVP